MSRSWDLRALKLSSPSFQHISSSKGARYSDLLCGGGSWELVVLKTPQCFYHEVNIKNHLIRQQQMSASNFFQVRHFYREVAILKAISFWESVFSVCFTLLLHSVYWALIICQVFTHIILFNPHKNITL